VRKRPGAQQRNLKRRESGDGPLDRLANRRDVGLRHVAQKLQRQMHVLRFDPFHVAATGPQQIDQPGGSSPNRLGHLHGNKRANLVHRSLRAVF
jgi:hypothetical protein